MSNTYYKECQHCGYTANNSTSTYWQDECPRCGSSRYYKESSSSRDEREERVSRQESESREDAYRDRQSGRDSGDSM